MSVHPIIRQIIDRDCHVSMSNRQVVRHVISRLRDGYSTFRGLAREDRRNLVLQCLARHAENRAFYGAVMRGYLASIRSRKPDGPRQPRD